MNLNEAQINQLYLFTRQHFVEWYDLQTELVDHLANAIETQWQEFPNRTFEDALQIEFKKFGVFGFSVVVQERHVALEKKYRKIVWTHFKNFFKLPQLIFTLLIFTFVLLVSTMSDYAGILFTVLLIFVVVLFCSEMAIYFIRSRRKVNKTGKKWLLKNIIHGFGKGSGLMFLPLQIFLYFKDDLLNNYTVVLASFYLVALALYQYVVIVIIPNKAEQYLKETYPEYEILK